MTRRAKAPLVFCAGGTGRLGRRDRLAFGPFLSAGAYLSYIGGAAFWSAYEVLL